MIVICRLWECESESTGNCKRFIGIYRSAIRISMTIAPTLTNFALWKPCKFQRVVHCFVQNDCRCTPCRQFIDPERFYIEKLTLLPIKPEPANIEYRRYLGTTSIEVLSIFMEPSLLTLFIQQLVCGRKNVNVYILWRFLSGAGPSGFPYHWMPSYFGQSWIPWLMKVYCIRKWEECRGDHTWQNRK